MFSSNWIFGRKMTSHRLLCTSVFFAHTGSICKGEALANQQSTADVQQHKKGLKGMGLLLVLYKLLIMLSVFLLRFLKTFYMVLDDLLCFQ